MYDRTSEERHAASAARWALAAFVIVGLLAFAFIATAPNSHAGSAASSTPAVERWQAPRCAEDQVISKRGRCLDRDDRTTRYQVVSEAGWGYWYDTRYPSTLRARALVPACHRWQMLTRWGGCVAPLRGDFRGGWWYHR